MKPPHSVEQTEALLASGKGLQREMEHLHKSSRRLIWLNPLLRYKAFQPLARGMQAILPHVDDFRSIHNLETMTDLVAALDRPSRRRAEGAAPWLLTIQ
ncbi:MAG: hypothetical protein BMS9Abin10_0233 [Gammaproteobacteria bacterium]|nr:MAG: hypothetical protein BMS9Abin10_0233 [Gammaproteobacteria bacterium]